MGLLGAFNGVENGLGEMVISFCLLEGSFFRGVTQDCLRF